MPRVEGPFEMGRNALDSERCKGGYEREPAPYSLHHTDVPFIRSVELSRRGGHGRREIYAIGIL